MSESSDTIVTSQRRLLLWVVVAILVVAIVIIVIFASTRPGEDVLQPLTTQELLSLGEKYLLELDYEQAILQFTAVIEVEPMNMRAYIGRADAHIALEHFDNAIKDYEFALSLDASAAEAYIKLADCHLAQGDSDAAIEVLERGYAITQDSAIDDKLQGLLPSIDTTSNLVDTMSESDKTMLNRYFSFFSEVETHRYEFTSFNREDYDIMHLAEFAVYHICINNGAYLVDVPNQDWGAGAERWFTVDKTYVDQVIEEYFGFHGQVYDESTFNPENPDRVFYDGTKFYVYWQSEKGYPWYIWSHVAELYNNKDDTYTAYVDVYTEVGHELTRQYEDTSNWVSDGEIHYACSFVAQITPESNKNNEVWKLLQYHPVVDDTMDDMSKIQMIPEIAARHGMTLRELKDIANADLVPEFEVNSRYYVSIEGEHLYYALSADDWEAADSDTCFRIGGSLDALVTGVEDTMGIAAFVDAFRTKGIPVSYGLEYGAGTASYISDYYAEIIFGGDDGSGGVNPDYRGRLLIELEQDNIVSPSSHAWFYIMQ